MISAADFEDILGAPFRPGPSEQWLAALTRAAAVVATGQAFGLPQASPEPAPAESAAPCLDATTRDKIEARERLPWATATEAQPPVIRGSALASREAATVPVASY